MMTSHVLDVEELIDAPYAGVLCYPKPTEAEVYSRIRELQTLGVEALEFVGQTKVCDVHVLGKGYVGVVVVAQIGGERAALKMRRVDADRADLNAEAELLKRANTLGVGPKFIGVSKNFLLSELVDGDLLVDWLKKPRGRAVVRGVLMDVLEQCWRLDEGGLDHGELSKASKHLLLNRADKPFIVDFESASPARKVINVTSVCQFFFQGNSEAAKTIAEMFGSWNRNGLVAVLQKYKRERTRVSFDGLLRVCFSEC